MDHLAQRHNKVSGVFYRARQGVDESLPGAKRRESRWTLLGFCEGFRVGIRVTASFHFPLSAHPLYIRRLPGGSFLLSFSFQSSQIMVSDWNNHLGDNFHFTPGSIFASLEVLADQLFIPQICGVEKNKGEFNADTRWERDAVVRKKETLEAASTFSSPLLYIFLVFLSFLPFCWIPLTLCFFFAIHTLLEFCRAGLLEPLEFCFLFAFLVF